MASLFDDEPSFEELAIGSAKRALAKTDIPVASPRTLFILSTTKGVIGIPPGETATKIAKALGVTTKPVVVCNACISGVAAQVLALRMIDGGYYDYVIVTGADVQNKFIISGFNSLKALSPEPCRPFDEERLGLNLGEGAATMVFENETLSLRNAVATKRCCYENKWHIVSGVIRNDAYHISGPHPKGEGSYNALEYVLRDIDRDSLACVGVHGTATMYNDQMESKAIERAGLSDVPLSALKGYYGHTMGAAGVIETVVTAEALDEGRILPSKGFGEIGVSGKVTISNREIPTDKRAFIKLLSGFGGCNGAVGVQKEKGKRKKENCAGPGTPLMGSGEGASIHLTSADDLTEIYKNEVGDYPKFYKMDRLSQLAFIAVELLMKRVGDIDAEHTAVILFNSTSSIVSDNRFIDTIKADNYFPSPAAFVYTLPNITTGEIAIRHGIKGETSFYILPDKDETLMQQILQASTQDRDTKAIISGWIDCPSETEYEAEVRYFELKS